jgi:hypothetical protein
MVKVCGCSDIPGIRMFFTAKSRPQPDKIHMMVGFIQCATHAVPGHLSNKLEMRIGNTSRVMMEEMPLQFGRSSFRFTADAFSCRLGN